MSKSENENITVSCKQAKNEEFSLATPNPDHKHITQDQVREMSLRNLTPEQRRHFYLNSPLNRKGSLFGPIRDQHREKAPGWNEELEKEVQNEKNENRKLSCQKDQPPSQDEAPRIRSKSISFAASMQSRPSSAFASLRVNAPTDMSIRGSYPQFEDLNSMVRMSTVAVGSRLFSRGSLLLPKISTGLPADLLKMSDWLDMEEKGESWGKRKHFLRIINTLDYDEKVMQVINHMTVHQLVDFYAENYNSNAHNYVWKDIWGNTLKMHRSLADNGLMDHSVLIDELGLDHFPTILIYFKDGFESDPPMQLDISKPDPDGIQVPCRNY